MGYAYRNRRYRYVEWVEQDEQKGTGHAVLCCSEAFADFDGTLLIVAGDMPLVRRATLSGVRRGRARFSSEK